jgi:hypothetical protein
VRGWGEYLQMSWRIVLLAIHDTLRGVYRREVYRYEQEEWRFQGLEATDWFARLVLKSQ